MISTGQKELYFSFFNFQLYSFANFKIYMFAKFKCKFPITIVSLEGKVFINSKCNYFTAPGNLSFILSIENILKTDNTPTKKK